MKFSPTVLLKNDKSFLNVKFNKQDTEKLLVNFNWVKAQKHDMISIWILQICEKSICKTLVIIYSSCSEKELFPQSEKRKHCSIPQKKVISNCYKITVQYHYFLFVKKFRDCKLPYNSMLELCMKNTLI